MQHYILDFELVPNTCHGQNLRTLLPRPEWQSISRFVRNDANGVCEICGRRVNGISELECHEEWKYVKKRKKNGKVKRIQKLVGLKAVCPMCHAVKHIGFAAHTGIYDDAVDWFMQVNGATYKEFKQESDKAWKKQRKRSKHKWKLDCSALAKLLENRGAEISDIARETVS